MKSKEKWLKVGKSGGIWGKVEEGGEKCLRVAKSGENW